jgi:hypothetical protein
MTSENLAKWREECRIFENSPRSENINGQSFYLEACEKRQVEIDELKARAVVHGKTMFHELTLFDISVKDYQKQIQKLKEQKEYIMGMYDSVFNENFKLKEQLKIERELVDEAYPEMLPLKYKAVQEKREPYKYIDWQERVKLTQQQRSE